MGVSELEGDLGFPRFSYMESHTDSPATTIVIALVTLLAVFIATRWAIGTRKDLKAVLRWPPGVLVTPKESPCTIAIIGAGMAGASAAYFCKHMFVDKTSVEIDVYEASNHRGGRAHVVQYDGRGYEAGAAVAHQENAYFVAFCELFGLKRRKIAMSSVGSVLRGSTPQQSFRLRGDKIFDTIALIHRYGLLNLIELKRVVKRCVDKFGMIYEQQRKGVAYESPQEMLQNLGTTTDNLAPMLDLSVDDYLTRECGIGEKLVKEVVNAGTRCNYRQPGRCLNAFCGTVSMAGTDVSSLFSVVGGNEQVPCKCLDESAARVVCDARVFKVEVLQKISARKGVRVHYNDSEVRDYHAVIIACPLESSGIDVVGSRNARKALGLLQTEGHSMCRTVSHFTKGKIRPSIVNSEGPISLAGVLTYEPDEDLPWTAIGCQIPVDATPEEAKEIVARLSRGEESVFKIFAERPLTEPEIDSLIERPSSSKSPKSVVYDWHAGAYPEYHIGKMPLSFDLGCGVFATSPMERAASALETACISGRNAALLVRKFMLEQGLQGLALRWAVSCR